MARYVLLQPRSLDCMALAKIGQWIALQGDKFIVSVLEAYQTDARINEVALNQLIENIRKCLNHNLPKLYHNELAIETEAALNQLLVINRASGHKSITEIIVRRIIEVLFTKNLTSIVIDTDLFLPSYVSKSHMLSSLVNLKIDLKTTCEADIIKLLKGLPNLQYLSLVYNCTNKILQCIADNCKLIEELYISQSPIDDTCADSLMRLEHLKVVNLRGTLITHKGLESILLKCTSLEEIRSKLTTLTLELIASKPENADKTFNLKTYSGLGITTQTLELVIEMCPLIETVTLRKNNALPTNLPALTGSEHLCNLILMDYDFYSDKLLTVLKIRGCNLMDLDLQQVNQIDKHAVMDISQYCPNLESLCIFDCRFKPCDSTEKKIQYPVLRNLKTLTFDTSSKLYLAGPSFAAPQHSHNPTMIDQMDLRGYYIPSPTTQHELKIILEISTFLLQNSIYLEYLDFGRSYWLTEEIFLTFLKDNPLSYLEELKMHQSLSLARIMTRPVLNQIIQNCEIAPEILIVLER